MIPNIRGEDSFYFRPLISNNKILAEERRGDGEQRRGANQVREERFWLRYLISKKKKMYRKQGQERRGEKIGEQINKEDTRVEGLVQILGQQNIELQHRH